MNYPKRKVIGLSIIIGLSLLIGYKIGYNRGYAVPADTTYTINISQHEYAISQAILKRDIIGGLKWAEDSETAGILLSVHDFIAGCTGEYGYITQSRACFDTFERITGEKSTSDPE
ncbi:MAG: hypothetical protein KCHDKBKB_00689 [Elusimicrobia bacterium]|nr:hypothetical protein [Elusimicrobiota bacterium]